MTLDERLVQACEATKRLGNTIPFLVDAIDNRLKHALGDRNNSEFIIDPQGKIVRKRTWSDPDAVRKDLEGFVGKVDKITKPEDIVLKVADPPAEAAAKGVVQKVPRTGLLPVVALPQVEKDGPLFFAKLRAEAEAAVIEQGKGKLYLGFHLDPFHKAHWNNLKTPLRFELEIPAGVKLLAKGGEAQKPKAESDIDPREFLLDVEAWPEGKTVLLTVTYAACTADVCHEVRQVYELRRALDRDGGRAVTGGFRARTPEEALKRLLEGDKNADGKLTKEELPAFLQSRFAEFDLNKDGVLDKDELKKMAEAVSQRKQ